MPTLEAWGLGCSLAGPGLPQDLHSRTARTDVVSKVCRKGEQGKKHFMFSAIKSMPDVISFLCIEQLAGE